MILTIETLVKYLGMDASILLADSPFKNWTFEKSFENDLEEPRIDYVFAQDGMDIVCDGEDKVRSIFLYTDESRCFNGDVQDLPLISNRQAVLSRLGSPSKSSGKIKDSILGEFGPWDRFVHSGYVIHIGYRLDADVINKITLMRLDVVVK